MNELTFAIEPLDGVPGIRWVTPLVDGVDLAELVRAHARTAGRWHRRRALGSVSSLEFVEVVPSGAPIVDALLAGGSGVAVLGCGCGNPACGDLRADIRIDDGLVTWEKFIPPAEPRHVFRDFGPFVFEIAAYRAAVEGLREH